MTKLKGARHRLIPERIEAGTFLIAGALTRSDLNIANCDPSHLDAPLSKLKEAGVKTCNTADSRPRHGRQSLDRLRPQHRRVSRLPYRHAGAIHTLATQAEGSSIITEKIVENRFMHAQELVRMGANIKI